MRINIINNAKKFDFVGLAEKIIFDINFFLCHNFGTKKLKKVDKMENTKYNGWTNYATWRVNLEYDLSSYDVSSLLEDCFEVRTLEENKEDIIYDLQEQLKEYIENSLELDCNNETTLSYARAFIDDVNWYEIATSIIENIEEEIE